jgi:hypothetical protein
LSLQRKLSDRAAGEKVMLTVKRRWQRIDVAVTLARPSQIGKFSEPEPSEPPSPTTNPQEDEPGSRPTSRPSTD